MNKPNRKDYLENIFLHEVAHYEAALLLGEQELARSEEALKRRKQNLLDMRLHYQMAKDELQRIRNEN